ncbi:unnamed protein product [Ophioblennius macclurei]
MAEPGRTVTVSGLPSGIEDDRLKDQLLIYFLRVRNGGGEIDSVTIVKATPVSALITFEDSRVAQRVIHRGQHTLDIDGKKYPLTVAEHGGRPDPDQVILQLSAIVQYRLLPGGVTALKKICKNHRDVDANYVSTEEYCILSGAYSKMQALLSQLFEHPESSESAANKKSSEAASDDWKQQKRLWQEPEHQWTKPNEKKEKYYMEKSPVASNSSSNRDLTPGGHDRKDTVQTESALKPSISVEDFSLILDADMFQYSQKHCQKDLQFILDLYAVSVTDMTAQGVTTLFVHAAPKGKTSPEGSEQERLKLAKNAISKFYQEQETLMRRAQVSKEILPSRAELKSLIQELCKIHPKVFVNEDDQNIYLVGNSTDVSNARQFLLLSGSTVRDGARDLKFPAYDSRLPTYADTKSAAFMTSSIGGFLDDKMDERKPEGAAQYKIAARFRDLGGAALGSRTTDFTSRAKSSTSRPSRSGPMLGHDVLSETSKISGEPFSKAVGQNTGEDILFKGGHALPSYASATAKTSLNPEVMDVRPKAAISPIGSSQVSFLGSSELSPAGSGATLRRTNSFSGTSQKKPQVMNQSEEYPSKSKVRTRERSSSFNSRTPRERQEVHMAELTVFKEKWLYIREAYKTRIEDLTSDVQMTERNSQGSGEVTLIIRGATWPKVDSCQQSLQALIDWVSLDFTVLEVPLSELGVTDTTDDTLQACCSEVRSRLKKVTIQLSNEKIYLLGPKQMCAQVRVSLRKVFLKDSEQISAQHHSSSLTPPREAFLPSVQKNKEQTVNPRFSSKSPIIPESQMGKANRTDWNKEWQTTYSSDFSDKGPVNGFIGPSLTRKDAVIKEKVKITDAVGMDRRKTNYLEDYSRVGLLKGGKSTSICVEKEGDVPSIQADSVRREQANGKSPREESQSSQEDSAVLCPLCETNPQSVTTKCGVLMCSECQKSHKKCSVCHKTGYELEQKPPGIHGHMSQSQLSISLPGHSKHATLKITYRIPDGTQAEGHPFPGKPFRGREFEAFFPDCAETKKLLPKLEKAFRRGLTFTVISKEGKATITWDCIPHKTSVQGGKAQNGYPDSSYLKRLSEILTQYGI